MRRRERAIKGEAKMPILWNDTEDLDLKIVSVGQEEETVKEDIHIPRFELVDSNERRVTTTCETPYVVYQGPQYPGEVQNLENEYEVDTEDEEFLEELSKRTFRLKDGTEFVVDDRTFEVIIDHLEKQSFDEREFDQVVVTHHAVKPLDIDDIPCCACCQRDQDDENLIVFCDGCDIAIHQGCQGLTVIPEGEWFCDACRYRQKVMKKGEPEPEIECCMCGQTGSAMKPTNTGEWIHVTCAMWIPDLSFDEKFTQVLMDKLTKKRSKLECMHCDVRGGCIQCHHRACYASYHPTCAQLRMQLMELHNAEENVSFVSYCVKHTTEREKSKLTTILKVQLGSFIHDKSTRRAVSEKLKGMKLEKEAFNAITEYWKEKRYKIKEGRAPLIRRLYIETETAKKEQELLEEGRSRSQKLLPGTSEEKYETMKKIREELETLRLITDQIRKRERAKQELWQFYEKFLTPLHLKLKLPENFITDYPELFSTNYQPPEILTDEFLAEEDIYEDLKPQSTSVLSPITTPTSPTNAQHKWLHNQPSPSVLMVDPNPEYFRNQPKIPLRVFMPRMASPRKEKPREKLQEKLREKKRDKQNDKQQEKQKEKKRDKDRDKQRDTQQGKQRDKQSPKPKRSREEYEMDEEDEDYRVRTRQRTPKHSPAKQAPETSMVRRFQTTPTPAPPEQTMVRRSSTTPSPEKTMVQRPHTTPTTPPQQPTLPQSQSQTTPPPERTVPRRSSQTTPPPPEIPKLQKVQTRRPEEPQRQHPKKEVDLTRGHEQGIERLDLRSSPKQFIKQRQPAPEVKRKKRVIPNAEKHRRSRSPTKRREASPQKQLYQQKLTVFTQPIGQFQTQHQPLQLTQPQQSPEQQLQRLQNQLEHRLQIQRQLNLQQQDLKRKRLETEGLQEDMRPAKRAKQIEPKTPWRWTDMDGKETERDQQRRAKRAKEKVQLPIESFVKHPIRITQQQRERQQQRQLHQQQGQGLAEQSKPSLMVKLVINRGRQGANSEIKERKKEHPALPPQAPTNFMPPYGVHMPFNTPTNYILNEPHLDPDIRDINPNIPPHIALHSPPSMNIGVSLLMNPQVNVGLNLNNINNQLINSHLNNPLMNSPTLMSPPSMNPLLNGPLLNSMSPHLNNNNTALLHNMLRSPTAPAVAVRTAKGIKPGYKFNSSQ